MSLVNKIEKGWQIVGLQWDEKAEQGSVVLEKITVIDDEETLIQKSFAVSSFAEIAELYGIQADSDKADLKAAKKADKQRRKIKADLEKLLNK